MGGADPSSLPSLAAGQLEALLACPRRLRLVLSPDERPTVRPNPAAFRLPRAVTDALRAAHEAVEANGTTLDEALVRTPPPDLGHEEVRRFAEALDHYVEAYDEQPWRLHGPSDGFWSAPSQHGGFRLGGMSQLVFRHPDAPPDEPRLAIRRVHLRAAPTTRPDGPRVADVALAALVRRGLPGTPTVEIHHLWTVPPTAESIRPVPPQAFADLRGTLDEAVHTATHGRAEATPGWWCSGCPSLKGCPAIPQQTALRRPATPAAHERPPQPPPDPTLGHPVQPAPGALVLSPSRYRVYSSCPRQYFLQYVLGLGGDPDDDGLLDGAPGIAAHAELHARHVGGMERHDDPEPVHEEGAADPSVLKAARAHATLCPRDAATYLGGELDLRFFAPGKAILLTGRIDALWRYPDGTLEVRDYKTGHCPSSLEDDLPAALYALLAHHHPSQHPAHPKPVRVVYESLGGETPRTVELTAGPDALQHAFERVVAFADRLRAERTFPARAGAQACRTCPYRQVCPKAWHGEGARMDG